MYVCTLLYYSLYHELPVGNIINPWNGLNGSEREGGRGGEVEKEIKAK